MIEIITKPVEMPDLDQRRFQKNPLDRDGNQWEVLDSENGNSVRYKGNFENASLACHNLNKKHYLSI